MKIFILWYELHKRTSYRERL